MPRAFDSWQATVVRLGYQDEGAMLRDLYEANRLSVREVANVLGQAYGNVKYRLKLQGIQLRDRGGPNHITKYPEVRS